MDPLRPSIVPPDAPLESPGGDRGAADDRAGAEAGQGGAAAALHALDTLPVAGFTRRRVAVAVAAVFAAWIVVVFARQVSEAAAATSRAEQAATDNARLQAQVAGLQDELALVERPEYVAQQARAYGLGSDKEIPFGLPAGAPPVSADAPGSAAQALGSDQERHSPLETWLSLLFGPGG